MVSTWTGKQPAPYECKQQSLTGVCNGVQPEEAGSRKLPVWAESPWSVRGQMFRLSRSLWEAGATPGAVIRTLGPWGPGLIQKYARSRWVLRSGSLTL